MSDALIAFSGVGRDYPSGDGVVHALDCIDLGIERGELVAITGSSGSGKSTAVNIMGTLDTPTTGSYRLDGQLVEGLDDTELALLRNQKIGFVFQAFHLLPGASALENVELPMVYAGVRPRLRRERARTALERVGLGERAGHRPNQLSGGQQQRVAIARALVNQPLLVLADEPTGNLDSANGQSILGLLDEFHVAGTTIVVITHDNAIATRLPRRISVLDGRVTSDTANPPAGANQAGHGRQPAPSQEQRP